MKTVHQMTLYALLLVMVAGAGCRTAEKDGLVQSIEGVKNVSIHVLFDQTRALPVSGTFGWGLSMLRVDPAHKVLLSEVEARIHGALLGALPGEGFTYSNKDPDYLVGFVVLVGASLSEAELNASYGNLLAFPARVEAASPLNYDAGVLILDIVERLSGRLLWRGAIKADIEMDLSAVKKQARCDGAIRELLQHYPCPKQQR